MMEVKDFDEHMWNLNKYGFTLVAVSFGHELGLFDLLMKEIQKLTSQEIADRASMKERYIREWLGCMVAAQIVVLEDDKYFIPPERHATIRAATIWGSGMVTWVKRFEQTKKCFSKAGPWGNDIYETDDHLWSFYGGFREETGDGFFDHAILPTLKEFPELNEKLETGIKVLDIGCGSGKFTRALAKRFPNSQVFGADISDKPLKLAREHPESKTLQNINFVKIDAQNVDVNIEETYDLIHANDVLHDLPDPKKALKELAKLLKPGGKMMIIEIRPHSNQAQNAGDMTAAMFYNCSMFCCLQNSLLQEPRVGYGACWGIEEMTTAIEAVYKIEKKVELPMLHVLLICSKMC